MIFGYETKNVAKNGEETVAVAEVKYDNLDKIGVETCYEL